jgi:hypothetical protein
MTPQIEAILDAVASDYNVTRYALLGRSLQPGYAQARQEFWWRLHHELEMTRQEIAAMLKRPLRTIETGIALRAQQHGLEAVDGRRAADGHAALKKMLREGLSFAEISDSLGYSIKSLPTLAYRLKVRYAGIRATPERPAIPEPLVYEYRRIIQAEHLTPVEAARRLNLME